MVAWTKSSTAPCLRCRISFRRIRSKEHLRLKKTEVWVFFDRDFIYVVGKCWVVNRAFIVKVNRLLRF